MSISCLSSLPIDAPSVKPCVFGFSFRVSYVFLLRAFMVTSVVVLSFKLVALFNKLINLWFWWYRFLSIVLLKNNWLFLLIIFNQTFCRLVYFFVDINFLYLLWRCKLWSLIWQFYVLPACQLSKDFVRQELLRGHNWA